MVELRLVEKVISTFNTLLEMLKFQTPYGTYVTETFNTLLEMPILIIVLGVVIIVVFQYSIRDAIL